MNAIHPNILTTIGNTPVVRINKLAPEGVNLYAKVVSSALMDLARDCILEHL